MPKMKSRKSATKRFRLSKSGNIKREKAYGAHILTKKTRKRKRNLKMATMVNASDENRVKRQLGIG